MGFLLLLALILLLCCGYTAPTKHDEERGRLASQEALKNQDKAFREFAKEHNCYYDSKNLNSCFYPDGSLKYDRFTKRSYQPGQYYANSKGTTASYGMTQDESKRAPK